MQTFLPYADFSESAHCLDYRRLGKQRVEAWQIYQIVSGQRTTGGWVNHPATKMWEGHATALAWYYDIIVLEWISRGYTNTMSPLKVSLESIVMPPFIGDKAFHDSHKSNLLRKDYIFYSQYNWQVPDNLPYIWGKGGVYGE